MSTRLAPKDSIDQPKGDVAIADGPAGPGDAPDGVADARLRRLVNFAVPVVLVGAFVVLGWTVEWFREGLGWIAPHASILLWGSVAAVLVFALIRRVVGALAIRSAPQRFGFLLAPAALAGSVIAYLVQLFGSWERGGASWFTIGGVVPWSDSYAYFGGAQRLLFDGQLDGFNSRRPIHAAFLASELAFTNLDLRKTLVIQAVLLGVASYLAARAVARDLGLLAGLVLFAGIYGFSRVGIQTVMSETLGLTLGALAFAALWSAVRRPNAWLVAGGLFLLTFALNFRSGPVLLLLTLPVAFAWLLRGSRRINWRVLGLSLAAVFVALSANYISIFTFHGDRQNLNSAANYWVYGMAKGVPGWSQPVSWAQIYSDYPEIIDMSETERNQFVSARAREELRAHPGTFARSYVEGARNYVSATGEYITAPVASFRVVAYAIALVLAAVVLIARWRTSSWRVLLDAALFGGVVLALPTIVGAWPYDDRTPWGWGTVGAGSYFPWWFGAAVGALAFVAFILVGTERLRLDRHLWFAAVTLITVTLMMPILGDDTVRLFATAVPFLALPLALAVTVIQRVPLRRGAASVPTVAAPRRDTPAQRWAPVLVGGTIAAVAVIGAPIAAAAINKPATPARTCPDGRRAEPLIGGAAVRLVGNKPGAEGRLDELDAQQVASSPVTKWLQKEAVVGPIDPKTTVMSGLNQQGHDRIAFVDGAVSAPGRSVLYLCGATISDSRSNSVLRWSAVPIDVFVGTPIDTTSTGSSP